MTMPMPAQGAAIEPVVLDPPRRTTAAALGPSRPDGLRHPRRATSTPPSRSLRGGGIERARRAAERSTSAAGEWRYVDFAEPDGNYVALVEARY